MRHSFVEARRFRVPVSAVLSLLAALAAACAPPPPVATDAGAPAPAPAAEVPRQYASVSTGRDVVRLMRDRYQGKWFRTMTFLQNNTRYKAGGGEDHSKWMEYYAAPGKLRIDYLPAANRSGLLYVDHHVYAFNGGKRISDQRQIHPLLLLGFDVYALETPQALALLDSLKIRLDVVREDSWNGRRAWVVGAPAGDTTSNQFWVDAERLVLVRLIQQRAVGTRTLIEETRFDRIVDMDGLPVATEVLMLRDGKPFFKEEYADVKLNVELDPALFDPARFGEVRP